MKHFFGEFLLILLSSNVSSYNHITLWSINNCDSFCGKDSMKRTYICHVEDPWGNTGLSNSILRDSIPLSTKCRGKNGQPKFRHAKSQDACCGCIVHSTSLIHVIAKIKIFGKLWRAYYTTCQEYLFGASDRTHCPVIHFMIAHAIRKVSFFYNSSYSAKNNAYIL